jgi:hypothetical protein
MTEDADITVDWNPVMVEKAIYRCSQRIAKGVLKADEAYRNFLDADRGYDMAFARSYLGHGDRPAHERKYLAELATEFERAQRDVADAAYKLMASNQRAIQGELEALRSIGTSVRQAYSTAGIGER